jgi:hypothetical protein
MAHHYHCHHFKVLGRRVVMPNQFVDKDACEVVTRQRARNALALYRFCDIWLSALQFRCIYAPEVVT